MSESSESGSKDGSTLSQIDVASVDVALAGPLDPQITLVAECDRPFLPSETWSLAGVDKVVLGRGADRRAVREGTELHIRVPDRWMSSVHATISFGAPGSPGGPDAARWLLQDADSKNGTVHRGEPSKHAYLADGDVIELGHTVFYFRAAQAALRATPAPHADLQTNVPELARRYGELAHVAASPVPVVLLGESGTGKEVLARAVHKMSGRRGAFVAVNCGSLPDTLVESELFGHKKGAFSGATEDRAGFVREADGGTLLLDEIGDLPLASQAALLRVLQEREVVPVGGSKPIKVDLRVLAATHHDLDQLIAAKRFRADLFARLNGFRMALLPLRERRQDIGTLVLAMIRRTGTDPASVTFTPRAMRAFLHYVWPLNIRELEKCVESAIALAAGATIDLQHLHEPVRAVLSRRVPEALATTQPLLLPDDARRREELIAALRDQKGNVAAVARILGKAPMQIHRWIKKFDLDLDSFRRPSR